MQGVVTGSSVSMERPVRATYLSTHCSAWPFISYCHDCSGRLSLEIKEWRCLMWLWHSSRCSFCDELPLGIVSEGGCWWLLCMLFDLVLLEVMGGVVTVSDVMVEGVGYRSL